MPRGKTWSRQEYERAMEMINAGRSREDVAAEFGRTVEQIRKKIEYENMPEWKREEYRVRVNAKRREISATKPRPMRRENRRPDVRIIERGPPEIFEDRAYRVGLSPRDLTAELCGDPKPGYSALERRA